MTKEEAIKELRCFIGQLTEGCQEAIKVLIPELRESEDEPDVDLEKEIDFYIGVYFLKCEDGTLLNADGDELRYTDVRKIAKHFYELGKGGSK